MQTVLNLVFKINLVVSIFSSIETNPHCHLGHRLPTVMWGDKGNFSLNEPHCSHFPWCGSDSPSIQRTGACLCLQPAGAAQQPGRPACPASASGDPGPAGVVVCPAHGRAQCRSSPGEGMTHIPGPSLVPWRGLEEQLASEAWSSIWLRAEKEKLAPCLRTVEKGKGAE